MVYFSPTTREITAKIVYYGPGMCGKTTNLQKVHEFMKPMMRGDLVSVATETDRTIYFDFLPVKLGKIAGMDFLVRSYTVPGQPYYTETRRMVLQGADGIVFVADSQRYMLDQNKESLLDLKRNLRLNGIDYDTIPLILQYNKRDLPDVLSIEDLDAALNDRKVQTFAAAAMRGAGVVETLKAITLKVFKHVRDGGLAGIGAATEDSAAPSAANSSPSAPPQQQPLNRGTPIPTLMPAGPAPRPAPVAVASSAPEATAPSINAHMFAGAVPVAAPVLQPAVPAAPPTVPVVAAVPQVPAPVAAAPTVVGIPATPVAPALQNAVQRVVANATQGEAPVPSKENIGLQEFQNLAVLLHRLTERVAQLEKEQQRSAQELHALKVIVGRKLTGS